MIKGWQIFVLAGGRAVLVRFTQTEMGKEHERGNFKLRGMRRNFKLCVLFGTFLYD